MDDVRCPDCRDMFDRTEADAMAVRHGDHHWHCAHCHEVTGRQGHWRLVDEAADEWGFTCIDDR